MTDTNIVKRIWDYGWITREDLQLSACESDVELLGQCIHSEAFHTFFIPGEVDCSTIHGPFEASHLDVSSFAPLNMAELPDYLNTIQMAAQEEDDLVARNEIQKTLTPEFTATMSSYRLNVDERNKELFHEAGFVLWIFREILFLNAPKGNLRRFVIGFD